MVFYMYSCILRIVKTIIIVNIRYRLYIVSVLMVYYLILQPLLLGKTIQFRFALLLPTVKPRDTQLGTIIPKRMGL